MIEELEDFRGLEMAAFRNHVHRAGGEMRQAVRSVSPRLSIEFIQSLAKSIDDPMIRERLIARLSVLFGVLSLLLGCAGLYGIMAYTVARRTQEIGIRIAIGGQRSTWSGLL